MNSIEVASLSVLTVLAAAGAYSDWRYRRLPNVLCLVAFGAGLVFGAVAHGAAWAGIAALHAVLSLLVGMFLFSRGWIGGGDAKFYAALAAWFPLSAAWVLITSVSLVGLVLLMVWFPFRKKFSPKTGKNAQATDFAKLPYGVAIAGGALAAMILTQAI